jgi:HSP20 family molecular chaperone IbpA
MREEIHRRMMDKILRVIGPDQDMFSDMEKMMDDLMADSFSGLGLGSAGNLNFSMEWLETATGRTLAITPQDPSQNLDISISNGMITIKGKSEHKSSHGMSVSNFSNMFNIPSDCDETKVKMDQKDGKILVQFPFRSPHAPQSIPKKQNERRPVHPSEEDVHI